MPESTGPAALEVAADVGHAAVVRRPCRQLDAQWKGLELMSSLAMDSAVRPKFSAGVARGALTLMVPEARERPQHAHGYSVPGDADPHVPVLSSL